jgi:hypothetical protein
VMPFSPSPRVKAPVKIGHAHAPGGSTPVRPPESEVVQTVGKVFRPCLTCNGELTNNDERGAREMRGAP